MKELYWIESITKERMGRNVIKQKHLKTRQFLGFYFHIRTSVHSPDRINPEIFVSFKNTMIYDDIRRLQVKDFAEGIQWATQYWYTIIEEELPYLYAI